MGCGVSTDTGSAAVADHADGAWVPVTAAHFVTDGSRASPKSVEIEHCWPVDNLREPRPLPGVSTSMLQILEQFREDGLL
jgi:hypothetical protein